MKILHNKRVKWVRGYNREVHTNSPYTNMFLGDVTFIFRQRNISTTQMFIRTTTGWISKIGVVNTKYDLDYLIKKAKTRVRTLERKEREYMRKVILIPSFYKLLDYCVNTLLNQFKRTWIDKIMLDISRDFQPNYTYFINLLTQFTKEMDLTQDKCYQWYLRICELIDNGMPDIVDYRVKIDYFEYRYTDRIHSKTKRMSYDDFSKAIEQFTDDEIMEMCTSHYGYRFNFIYDSGTPDFRYIFYRLTHNYFVYQQKAL